MIHKRKQRSKALVVMLMPALIVIGLVGLFMYLSGNQYSRPSKITSRSKRECKADGVSFLTAVYEEEAEVTSK